MGWQNIIRPWGGEFVAATLKATTTCLIDDGGSYGQDLVEAARRLMKSRGVAVKRESVRRVEGQHSLCIHAYTPTDRPVGIHFLPYRVRLGRDDNQLERNWDAEER